MKGVSVFFSLLFCSHQGKLPLLLSRMNEVAKVFLATNSDYKYTDVSSACAHCLGQSIKELHKKEEMRVNLEMRFGTFLCRYQH